MHFTVDDGLTLSATYYPAAKAPAPGILLIHDSKGDRSVWQAPGQALSIAGYNALAIDLRGYGETGGKPDWGQARMDITTVLVRLSAMAGVDPQKVSAMGFGTGANLALAGCATFANCRSVVLISPTLSDHGIDAQAALSTYGNHPLLIITSQADSPSSPDSAALDKLAGGDHTRIVLAGSAHGADLLTAQPDLVGRIQTWLGAH
jgi:dienelactone hydrolase